MKTAIYRLSDGAIVARWDDPAVTDPSGFPFAPDGCAYVSVSDAVYDDLAEILTPEERLGWQYVNSEVSRRPKPNRRPFYVICNSVTRAVLALDRDVPSVLPSSLETVAISATDYSTISEALWHDADQRVPAWDCAADGTVTPRPDVRPVLVVSHADNAVVGLPYSVDFQVTDSQGSPLPINGSRNLKVIHNGTRRLLRITMTNGQKNETPTFQEAGRYELVPENSTEFRMGGNPIIEVAEQW